MVDENQTVEAPVEKTTAELREELEVKTKLLELEERSKALRDIGGKSIAGEPKPEVVEETPAEYAARVTRGDLNEQVKRN